MAPRFPIQEVRRTTPEEMRRFHEVREDLPLVCGRKEARPDSYLYYPCSFTYRGMQVEFLEYLPKRGDVDSTTGLQRVRFQLKLFHDEAEQAFTTYDFTVPGTVNLRWEHLHETVRIYDVTGDGIDDIVIKWGAMVLAGLP